MRTSQRLRDQAIRTLARRPRHQRDAALTAMGLDTPAATAAAAELVALDDAEMQAQLAPVALTRSNDA